MKLISSLAILPLVSAQQICGNYCGLGWCNGDSIRETDCDDSVKPTSPADACCMMHDDCCGHAKDTSSCNKMLVQCLSRESPSDLSCTRSLPFIPFPTPVSPMVIEKTIGVIEDWCCGKPCPKEVAEQARDEAVSKAHRANHDSETVALVDAGQHSWMESVVDDYAEKEQSAAQHVTMDWALVGAAAVLLAAALAVVTLVVKRRQRDAGDYISLDPSQD
eukprot:TRINITY_DN98546_c0_g1_i1.p1 TRINITY_DN98546_c0_g1~~TRINITY_DN98546_c0_g1_i1.p1  ORF type:complete len:219 (+),score=41.76 TRINITY_DN98546_c0_g1_i1:76-732(+)